MVLILGLSFSTPSVDRCPTSGDLDMLEEPIEHLSKRVEQPQCNGKGHKIAMYVQFMYILVMVPQCMIALNITDHLALVFV